MKLFWLQYAQAWITAKFGEEKGQDLAEYALLLGLIAVAAIVAIGVLSGGIQDVLNDVGDRLTTAVGGGGDGGGGGGGG